MHIRVIGSSSYGNCYILFGENSNIMIETGIEQKKVIKSIGAKEFKKIKFGLISHEHKDHIKFNKEYNFTLYVSSGNNFFYNKNKFTKIEPFKIKKNDEWEIKNFPVLHNVINHGWWIRNNVLNEIYLFATDCYKINFKFKNITHYFIECNYCQNILNENIRNGIHYGDFARKLKYSHMELDNLIQWLSENNLKKTKTINLIHISKNNADAELMQYAINKKFNKVCNLCFNNTEIFYKGE